MKGEPTNTPENQLSAGFTEEQLLEAVRKSGYPLQTVIASALRIDFAVQEEWSFVDGDTGSLRTLDIVASRRMYTPQNEGQPFIRPTLDLLIECKQSDLPFVFFISETRPRLRHLPYIAGLARDTVTIKTDDSRSTWTLSVLNVLSLADHPFLMNPVEPCMSFSKCVRRGKEVELSGTDAYQGLVLPLIKALRYFRKKQEPPSTARYFDCHIPLAIAVIDAPMIAARIQNDQNKLSLTPWVRVVRNEAVEAENYNERTLSFGIDVVHKSFFNTYLQQHAIPFAQQFAPSAIKHHVELSTGKGFASGMNANSYTDLEKRLQPKRW
jgi:hypothetical protein